MSKIKGTALVLLILAGCGDADPVRPEGGSAVTPNYSVPGDLSGLSEDDIYASYLSGELATSWSTYMGPLTITPWFGGTTVMADLIYEYFSTTQRGQVTVTYKEGNQTLGSIPSGILQTGGPRLWRDHSWFWHNAEMPISGETCGKSVLGSGWGEVFNEVSLVKYFIPPFGHVYKQGSNEDHAPSCPPPGNGGGGGGGGGEGCYYCEYWVWEDEFGNIVEEYWECTPIDPAYCAQT